MQEMNHMRTRQVNRVKGFHMENTERKIERKIVFFKNEPCGPKSRVKKESRPSTTLK